MNGKQCSWPVDGKDAVKMCGRRAVVVFQNGKVEYPRCSSHASERAYATAEESGYRAVAL